MFEDIFTILKLLFRLYAVERFPDAQDLSNPHMLIRILLPMLNMIGWNADVNGTEIVIYKPE